MMIIRFALLLSLVISLQEGSPSLQVSRGQHQLNGKTYLGDLETTEEQLLHEATRVAKENPDVVIQNDFFT